MCFYSQDRNFGLGVWESKAGETTYNDLEYDELMYVLKTLLSGYRPNFEGLKKNVLTRIAAHRDSSENIRSKLNLAETHHIAANRQLFRATTPLSLRIYDTPPDDSGCHRQRSWTDKDSRDSHQL